MLAGNYSDFWNCTVHFKVSFKKESQKWFGTE